MVFLYDKPKIRCFDLIFQMADKNVKNEENAKKAPKRNARIIYRRCQRCGGKKKEEELGSERNMICIECSDKIAKDRNNFWTRNLDRKAKEKM